MGDPQILRAQWAGIVSRVKDCDGSLKTLHLDPELFRPLDGASASQLHSEWISAVCGNHHIRKVVASGVQLGNDSTIALLQSLSGHPSLKVLLCFLFALLSFASFFFLLSLFLLS